VGLLAPDGGEVEAGSGKIGYLFQSGALMAWLTVAENVALPLVETTSLSRGEIDAKVEKALAAVGLSDAADKYPAEISGGMQKRAGLARAIVRESDIVLYDEPTSGLDPVTAASIDRLIVRLNRERGVTSVVVTHDLASALKMSARVMLLKDGRVLECAAPQEFLKSTNPAVKEFIAAAKGEMT
jgi:phospholipid/cholesterol/gamma-HCH transport system ATP-binding protein